MHANGPIRTSIGALLAGVVGLLLLPSVAAGQNPARSPAEPSASTPVLIERARARGDISRFEGDLYLALAFADHERLPPRFRSDAPWDGTLPLLELRERVAERARGARRARLKTLLAAASPTKCDRDSAPPNSTTSAHFLVHYPDSIGGGLTITDYVTSLETAWTREVNSFGWAAPPLHSGTSGKYHVIVADLSPGLYGFVTTSGTFAGTMGDNPNTTWTEPDAVTTCMALNKDYSAFESAPQDSLDSTTAHEFNHSIQFGYGAMTGSNAPDDAFIEGGATWMEDEVFDGADDNYNFLWPDFDQSMGSYGASPYPYWITFRGLTERYGTGTAGGGEQVMQDFWEAVSKGTHLGLNAMNRALQNRGSDLADAFHAYAITAKFSKTCGGSYVLPYCFEEGAGYVAAAGVPATNAHGGTISGVGGSFNGSVADNYALNWVALPTGSSPYGITLNNTDDEGGRLRATIACDTGTQLRRSAMPTVVGAGASTPLSSFDPAGCSSVVAVITNQSQTGADPSSSALRSYTLQTTAITDGSPPSAPAQSSLSRFQTKLRIPLSWTASSDPETGVETYELQRQVAPPNQLLGPWEDLASVATTSTTFRGRPGYTYCFRVAATNGAGLTSPWSEPECTSFPRDDPALNASSGWVRDTDAGYYLGTFTRDSTRGRTLTKTVTVRRLALVATRCPECGTVTVRFDGTLVKRISLDAATTKKKAVIAIPAFSTAANGTVTVKIVSSGRPVTVDGLGTSAL